MVFAVGEMVVCGTSVEDDDDDDDDGDGLGVCLLIFSVGKIVMRRNQPQGCFYVRISMTGLFCYFAILPFGCFVILFILLLKAFLTKYQAFQISARFKISN